MRSATIAHCTARANWQKLKTLQDKSCSDKVANIMAVEMDDLLVQQFAQQLNFQPPPRVRADLVSNPGPWHLACEGSDAPLLPQFVRVVACQDIPAKAYLGDVEGRRCYAWELEPSAHLFWVEDDLILDCSALPRCMLSLMREGFYEGMPCNCELVVFSEPHRPGYLRVGMRTLRAIRAGEELVFERTVTSTSAMC
jgi:hypothetical protein